jgi:hypothetical protein
LWQYCHCYRSHARFTTAKHQSEREFHSVNQHGNIIQQWQNTVSCLQNNRPPIEQPVAQEPMTQILHVIAQNHHQSKDNLALQLAGDPFGFPFSNHQSLTHFKPYEHNFVHSLAKQSHWADICRCIEKSNSILSISTLFKSAIISHTLSASTLGQSQTSLLCRFQVRQWK